MQKRQIASDDVNLQQKKWHKLRNASKHEPHKDIERLVPEVLIFCWYPIWEKCDTYAKSAFSQNTLKKSEVQELNLEQIDTLKQTN